MSLIEELKRQRVLRVGVLYMVAGWLLLQVADIIVGLLGLPNWVLRTVLYVLIAGFPLMLTFILVRASFSGGHLDDRFSNSLERVVGRFVPARLHRPTPQSATHDSSVAVLPFRNLGRDTDDYLADGLTEELLTALAKSDSLRVPSRTSCFQFRAAADLPSIASALQVDHILEGSVRKADGRFRVSAQLVAAASDSQIWSETYDRSDIYELHAIIAQAVARSLDVEFVKSDADATVGPTAETYTAYLKGRYALNRASAEGCREAVEHFEHVLATDPRYSRAHAGIAQAFIWLGSYGSLPSELGFRRARQSAERALALDDRLPEAHVAIGRVQLGFDWDFAGAETSYRRALELDSTNAEALQRYGHFLQMMGRWEDAIATRRKAIDLDPLSIPVHFGLADTYFTAGRVDEALIEINKIHELDTGYPVYHLLARIELARSDPRKALEMIGRDNMTWRKLYISAIARYQLGEHERGDALLRQLVESHGEDAALQIAIVFAQKGDHDHAFSWLERACEQRDSGMIELKADPELEPLRKDVRFQALLKKVGFPD